MFTSIVLKMHTNLKKKIWGIFRFYFAEYIENRQLKAKIVHKNIVQQNEE